MNTNTVEAKSGRYPWGKETVDKSNMDFIKDYYDYGLYDDYGHILVFRHDGSFVFSADTVDEAEQDIDAGRGSLYL